MSDAGEAVRRHRALLGAQYERHQAEREELHASAEKLEFAWLKGHENLYKFKSMSGESRDHVFDIIRNSRIYFSSPTEFNDPLDCAPICSLAKPLTNEFINELLDDEAALARGLESRRKRSRHCAKPRECRPSVSQLPSPNVHAQSW
jgi:hypothetical protein